MKRTSQGKAGKAPPISAYHIQRKDLPTKDLRLLSSQNSHAAEEHGIANKATGGTTTKGKKRFPFEIFTAGHVKRLRGLQDPASPHREALHQHLPTSQLLSTPTAQTRPSAFPRGKIEGGPITNLPSPSSPSPNASSSSNVPTTGAISQRENRELHKQVLAGRKQMSGGRAGFVPQVQTLQQLLRQTQKTPIASKPVPLPPSSEKEQGKDPEQSLLSSTQFIPVEGQKEPPSNTQLRHKLETSRRSNGNPRISLALMSNFNAAGRPLNNVKPITKITMNLVVDSPPKAVGKCVPCNFSNRGKDEATSAANIHNHNKVKLKYTIVKGEMETRKAGSGQTAAIKVRLPKGFVVAQHRPSSNKEEKKASILVPCPQSGSVRRSTDQKPRLDIGSSPMKKSVEQKAAQERAAINSLREQCTAATVHASSRSVYDTTHTSKQSTQPETADDVGPMLINRLADLRQARAEAEAYRHAPEDVHYVTFGRDQFSQLHPPSI